MSLFACINLGEEANRAVNAVHGLGAMNEMDRGTAAWDLIRGQLTSDDRALFDAEATGLPEGLRRAIADLIVTAVEENLEFRFESQAPESVMDFARNRKMRFTFELDERGIGVVMQHTLRHPSWLPEVVMPEVATAAVTA